MAYASKTYMHIFFNCKKQTNEKKKHADEKWKRKKYRPLLSTWAFFYACMQSATVNHMIKRLTGLDAAREACLLPHQIIVNRVSVLRFV